MGRVLAGPAAAKEDRELIVFTVLVTDHPAPSIDIEVDLVSAAGGRLIVASTGDEAELVSLVGDADAILTCFRQVSPDVIRAGKRLKVIGRYGVGVDNIAVDVASSLGIQVTNVPVYCDDEVAEHAIAMLLTLARRTSAYDASIRAGAWDLRVGVPLHRVAGSVLGVIGFGRIGRGVVRRGLGLGMRVLVADRSATSAEVSTAGAHLVPLLALLEESDAVSLHLPLLPSTRHLISAQRLASMKRGAFLINCARGGIVDLDALTVALLSGHLGGAGLDVFDPERLQSDHPLVALPNVVLTPHVAFYSEESISVLQHLATENVLAVLNGVRPHSVVSPSG